MPAIDVVSDASVALKWFHADGEEEVEPARALVAASQARTLVLQVLDLTAYEIGNALIRGRAKASPEQVGAVLDALREVCPAITPTERELHVAAELADRHGLTYYDAAYAAVALSRHSRLATLDRRILDAGLGVRPSDLAEEIRAARRPERPPRR